MSGKENGGPAFPLAASEYGGHGPSGGMSLRDYFAAKAMQAMVAVEFDTNFRRANWAEESYRVADAMIAERAK